MATIQENLQTLADIKADIKVSLENQNKAPTNSFATYSGLVDGLENPDDITYCVTLDGENKTYAQLHGQEKVTLTATANDIRLNTSAITNKGYTEGEKDIPSYYTTRGYVAVRPNGKFEISTLKNDRYDYTDLQCLIAPWNTSIEDSVAIDKTVLYDAVYPAGSTEKLADVIKDAANKLIDLGITNGTTPYVIHFMTCKEEI